MDGRVKSLWTASRLRRPGMLALTYDDGPGTHLTPRVCDLLDRAGAKATFFLLGRRATQAPQLVHRLAAAGHELACHTHDHLNAWKSSPWRVNADIRRGYQTLAPWVPPSGLFRPPYGKVTPFTLLSLRRRGARVIWWTHDSMDTTHGSLPTPPSVVDRVMQDRGGVVLLHDFDRERDAAYNAARAEFVLEVTRLLLDAAQHSGIRVTTVGQLIASTPAEVAA